MRVLITGTSSGLGLELTRRFPDTQIHRVSLRNNDYLGLRWDDSLDYMIMNASGYLRSPFIDACLDHILIGEGILIHHLNLLRRVTIKPTGHLLMISTKDLRHMPKFQLGYNAGKAGLEAAILTLAKEVPFRCNVLRFGLIGTQMCDPKRLTKWDKVMPVKDAARFVLTALKRKETGKIWNTP